MRRSVTSRDRIGRVVVHVGGVGQKMLAYFLVNQDATHTALLCDVESENAAFVRISDRLGHAQALALGEAETSRTLLAARFPMDHPIHSAIGVASGREGMGQARNCGRIAAEKALFSTQFRDAQNSIQDRLIDCCGGIPSVVEVLLLGSTAGGTSAGAVIPIGRTLAEKLLGFGSVVHLKFHLVDSMTFTGLGRHVHRNSAAFVSDFVRTIRDLRSQVPPDRLVLDLNVSALPLSLADDAIRGRRVRTTFEARQCAEFLRDEQTANPNQVLAGPLGNVTFSTYDQFEPISTQEVCETVATVYFNEFTSALGALGDSASRVQSFTPGHRSTSVFRPEVGQVLDDVQGQSNRQTLNAVKAVGEDHRFFISATTMDGTVYDLDRISGYFAAQPATLTAAMEQLSQVQGIRAGVGQEVDATAYRIQELREATARSEGDLVTLLDRMRKPTWFGTRGKVRRKAEAVAHRLRQEHDELTWYVGLHDRLLVNLQQVSDEERTQRQRLENIRTILDSHRRKGRPAPLHPLFHHRSVEEAFPMLMALPSHAREIQQILIGSVVTEVTVHGLQRLSGAATAHLEAIVDALASAAPVPGPGVGGVVPVAMTPVYVVPPTEAGLKSAVIKAFELRLPRARLYFQSHATMGLEVTRIVDYRPLNETECFPGLLKTALEASLEAPSRWLFHGPEVLNGEESGGDADAGA